jgi:hypothetical protein
MKTVLSTVILAAFLAVPMLFGAETSDGHRLLFAGVRSGLSEQDQKDIFSQLTFTVTKVGDRLLYEERDAAPVVEVVDLNGDMVDEVFIYYGTGLACGHTGRCLALFIKNSKGRYTMTLDLTASGYERLRTASMGFPDIGFVGPGFCQGVWRWSGVKYEHLKNVPTMEGGCDAIEKRQWAR